MNAPSGNFKTKTAANLASFFLILSMLSACSPSNPATQFPEMASEPAFQSQIESQPPVIQKVIEREESLDGSIYVYQDLYFRDPDGDAIAVTYRQVSSSLAYPLQLTDDPVLAPAAEQKREARVTVGGKCQQKMELVFESRIRDQVGNLSGPVTFRISCMKPSAVGTQSILVGGFIMIFSLALILLLGFWLLFRKNPLERLPALRSMILFFSLVLWLTFMQRILHEGGHALYTLIRGVPSLLYVHPFNFPGYSRPILDSSVWKDISGSVSALLLSLLISLPFWNRRSLALLPLTLLFPYVLIYDGINVLGLGGDFRTLVQTNGISPIPFLFLGALLFITGIILLFGLLPLVGLDPKDKKALFVLPAAMFLAGVLSLVVASIVVPGSPIDQEYFLGQEIVSSAYSLMLVQTVGWAVFSGLYATLFRRVHLRQPPWLRTETVQLTSSDLRLPAILAGLSIISGLVIIT